jgi:hypothetical protein
MLDGQQEEDRDDEGGEMTLGIRWVYYDDAGVMNDKGRYEKDRHRLTRLLKDSFLTATIRYRRFCILSIRLAVTRNVIIYFEREGEKVD